MAFWSRLAQLAVGAVGYAGAGVLGVFTGGAGGVFLAGWTTAAIGMLEVVDRALDDNVKRAEQLNQATENANKAKDLTEILDSAEEDINIAQGIRNKDKEKITPEEQKDALERLTQGYIKVAGIALSVNPQKNDSEILKRMEAIGEKVSLDRIAWRARLHKDYKIDIGLTQEEAQKQKNQLQDLLNKLEGKEGEEAHVLRSQIQVEIDYLEGKVAPEHQPFVDERRKEVEALKTLKREHEEAFNKAKESVENNAVTGVEDAEKALEKRAEFDSKFKEFLNQLRSKKEDLPHVLTPDILISIADFYSVFRDPELLHNEVFATAYKQQAERNEQVVFDTPLSAYRKAKEHLARSVELYKIYDKHIDNKEFTLARKLRFQVEAHQREATRIAEQIPAKFRVWEGGTAKEKIATAWSGLKNTFKLGDKKSLVESLNSQINAHGDKIHKAMHLADLGEDDFYRNGLEATKNYFIQDGIKSQARSALIQDVEAKIPNLDARERAVESQAGVGVSERLQKEDQTEQAQIKTEEQENQEQDSQAEDQEDDLGLPSVPTVSPKAVQEPEPKAKAEDQEEDLDLPAVPNTPIQSSQEQDKEEEQEQEQEQERPVDTGYRFPEGHQPYKAPSSPQAEKIPVPVEEANFVPLTPEQKADKKAKEERDRIINERYRIAVKANIARLEEKARKDRDRWAKLSDEEIIKKFNLIYELFDTKDVSSPELLFDGDLTVLDRLTMNEVVDQEKWKEITDEWKKSSLSHQEKWDSLSRHFKLQAVFAYDSGYGSIYDFIRLWKGLKLPLQQLEAIFLEEHKLSLERELSERSRKSESHGGYKYYDTSQEEKSELKQFLDDTGRIKDSSLLHDITFLKDDIARLKKKSDGSDDAEEEIKEREEELKAKEKKLKALKDKTKEDPDGKKAEADKLKREKAGEALLKKKGYTTPPLDTSDTSISQPIDTGGLSEDLLKRFEKLRTEKEKPPTEEISKPIEAEKPKVSKPITRPVVSPQEKAHQEKIDQQYQQAVEERERFLTSVEDDDDLRVYGVSRKDGKLVQRLLKKGEKPRADEGTAYGYDCIIRLPPIDTGDAFNNFSGKKIRIFKGSIKVINTSDVEVGVYGEEMHPIEELIGSPKTGEFTFPIYSNSQYLPELVIKHKGEHSHFHLTSVTTHFSVED
ncbi:hypothetical protein AYJ09_01430 [Candidatus Liberibacter solanacearum]|uniref:hypothetical protein n=1 Tax=Candidatus Liberibacter solanacearum TaxID=556287 RepID=UPI0009CA2040|nr:hypothetical protein [Candidatus Liberibacter solanacearum]ONI59074.1 hypothetical protein AYJ09_01430 [Candidatus Liberibacter solanacearum]